MKRLIDALFGSLAIIVLSPLFIILALLVRIFLGSPVLFRQDRPGIRGKPFELVKFRTMTSGQTSAGELLPDSFRLNGFGRFLRSTSLDELPEFWNVVRGDMSLVGPRPLLVEYLPLYSTEQARRHDIRPGLTGLAQVRGRNSLSWVEKFRLDVWYVDNKSFTLDAAIIFWTVKSVLTRSGVTATGSSTVSRFDGFN